MLDSIGRLGSAEIILNSNYRIRGGAVLANTLPNELDGPTLDLGCGCGVIGIASALKGGNPAYLVDSDGEQCQIANQNLRRLGIKGNVVQWDYFDGEPHFLRAQVNLIVSNPPQLPTNGIPWSIRDCGGEDGWSHIDRILSIAESHVSPDGLVFLYVLGFLGITIRAGNRRSLTERASAVGFQLTVAAQRRRHITSGEAVARSIKHIAKLYPLASFWVEHEQKSVQEAATALGMGQEVEYDTYVVCLRRL